MNLSLEIAIIGLIQAVAVALLGGMFARNSKKNKDNEARIDKRAEIRAKESQLSMRLMAASVNLGVATCIAVKEGSVNGKMNAALKSAELAQQEYYQFINSVAAEQIIK